MSGFVSSKTDGCSKRVIHQRPRMETVGSRRSATFRPERGNTIIIQHFDHHHWVSLLLSLADA
jgi:hypothetical protein